jgi:hypothetical protein
MESGKHPKHPKGLLHSFTVDAIPQLQSDAFLQGVFRCQKDLWFNARLQGGLIHGFELTPEVCLEDTASIPKLVLGTEARITGVIVGRQVVVNGYVEGEIHATHSIHITHLGYLKGKAASPKLKLEYGAVLNGSSTAKVESYQHLMKDILKRYWNPEN